MSGRLSWVGFSEYAGHWGYRREQWDFTDLFGFEGHSKESGSPPPTSRSSQWYGTRKSRDHDSSGRWTCQPRLDNIGRSKPGGREAG